MSLSGLQNSWGGGEGGSSAPPIIDVPIAYLGGNVASTGQIPYGTAQTGPPAIPAITSSGNLIWDISSLVDKMGQTIVSEGPPVVTTYVGTLSVTFRVVLLTQEGLTYINDLNGITLGSGRKNAVGFTVNIGQTLDALASATAYISGQELVDGGVGSSQYYTFTLPVETQNPNRLFVGVNWFFGPNLPPAFPAQPAPPAPPVAPVPPFPTANWLSFQPLGIYMTPNAQLTTLSGNVPVPEYTLPPP